MFAVKGWSVDSSALKTQTQPVKEVSKKAVPDTAAEKSKKRKRERKDKNVVVDDENVGELWQKTMEGKTEGKKDEEKKDEEKKDDGAPKPPNKRERNALKRQKMMEDGTFEIKRQEQKQKAQETKGKNKKNKKQKDENKDGTSAVAPPPAVPALPTNSKLTPMQSAMRQKLISARFRHLNETLYTAPSATALALFAENPDMFDDYHSGFRQQVTTWPENPVDKFISALRARGRVRLTAQNKAFRNKKRNKKDDDDDESSEFTAATPGTPALPRTHGTCTIADLGCGDARLAATFAQDNTAQKLNLKILSYDLHSKSPLVTKSDIADLPLKDGSVDVAIFCLALMGTNWIDFIEEAYRVLHWKGELWVAEIKSRFGRVGGDKKQKNAVVEHSVGNRRKPAAKTKATESEKKKLESQENETLLASEVDGVTASSSSSSKTEETDVSGFVEVLKRRGFVLKDADEAKSVDLSNKMFVKMEFIKAAPAVVGKNVRVEEERKGDDGTWKRKQKRFLEVDDKKEEVSVEDEMKALKPCLYKIR